MPSIDLEAAVFNLTTAADATLAAVLTVLTVALVHLLWIFGAFRVPRRRADN